MLLCIQIAMFFVCPFLTEADFAIKTNGRAEEGWLGFCRLRNEKGYEGKSIMKTAILDGL